MTMMLQTELQRETAATLSDDHNLLHHLLPVPADATYRCLGFVDWYGDTMFNHLQMASLLAELDRIRGAASDAEDLALLDAIKGLAEQCRDADGRLYLWFYGD